MYSKVYLYTHICCILWYLYDLHIPVIYKLIHMHLVSMWFFTKKSKRIYKKALQLHSISGASLSLVIDLDIKDVDPCDHWRCDAFSVVFSSVCRVVVCFWLMGLEKERLLKFVDFACIFRKSLMFVVCWFFAGSTVVMKAINTNHELALRKAGYIRLFVCCFSFGG